MNFLDAGRIGLITTIRDRLTASPRAAIIGFSLGDPAWDGSPPPSPSRESTALVAPIAYVVPGRIAFAKLRSEVENPTPMPVVVGGAEYEVVQTPTSLLLVEGRLPATFAFETGRLIREVGLFLAPTIAGSVPAGETRFQPADVTAAGALLLVKRFSPLPHDGSNSGITGTFLLEL